jgi:hypothetical protein
MFHKKCVIILSERSSGSSACQNLLAKFANVRHVSKTRHFQNETLYWTKAASILGKPQIDMVDSEVPIERNRARADLIELLRDNLGNCVPASTDMDLIMDGWKLLCEKYAPVFLEKSPHHLCQWSAIELIMEAIRRISDVDFLLIGLVRNPMDTIYSNFQRWRSRPEQVEREWLIAYQNLIRLKEIMGDKVVIIRYEDMVSSIEYMKPVFDFCEVDADVADRDYLHQKSLSKWKSDPRFGFVLSTEVIELAGKYGYDKAEITHENYPLWPVYRECSRAAYMAVRPVKMVARRGFRMIRSIFGT